jgi:branched-chain amino acid transport system permease protein
MIIMNTLHRHLPGVVLAAVVIVSLILTAGQPSVLNLVTLIGIYGLMATSLGMIYGQAGMMSLCQAGFAAVGAYSTAIMSARWGFDPLLGLVVALLLPAAIAYPFARLIVKLSPLALALATLFLGSIITIVLNQGGDFTGGYLGIGGIPMLSFAATPLKFAALVWLCAIVFVILYTNLLGTAAGRALNTLRVDAVRSQADGDRGPHRLSMLFAFAAGLAGCSGWLYAHYMAYVAPETLSMDISMTLLLMVLLGGARHVLGPILGAFLLTYLNDLLPAEMRGLLYGSAIVVVLIIAPRGVLGTLDTLWNRRLRKKIQSSGLLTKEDAARSVPAAVSAQDGEGKG